MGYNLLQIVGFFGFFCVGIMWVCRFINFYCWHVCLILRVFFNYFMDMLSLFFCYNNIGCIQEDSHCFLYFIDKTVRDKPANKVFSAK